MKRYQVRGVNRMVEKVVKKISDSYIFIMSGVVLIIFLIIMVEVIAGVFSHIDEYKLYGFSQGLGSVGAFLAFTALIFYPLRKMAMVLRKKYTLFSTKSYMTLSKITAHLHPVIALIAFSLLFIHGFIFLKVIYQFDFFTILTMGAMTLSALTILFLSGTFLKKKLSRKKLRAFHFIMAIVFIIFFALHMLIA
jgi:hypothetical protein